MATDTPAIAELYKKITTYLEQASISFVVDADGSFAIRQGTAAIFIHIVQWNAHTFVQLASPIALDITNTSPELAFFLASQNNKLLFGKFSLDIPAKTVWFEQTLLGDFLQPEELTVALEIIAVTADGYDEQVALAAGGKRAIDFANKLVTREEEDV